VRDVAIDDFLAELGLAGPAARRGREVLESAALTRPGKQRLAEPKLAAAREAIDGAFARLCAACAARLPQDGRDRVAVPAAACSYCGGSAHARALRELADAAARAGVERLVVVGGSPSVREELERAAHVELRLVDGTRRRTAAEAGRDVDWADVIVVAGSSELAHKVSNLYTRDGRARGKLVVADRRGVEAIAAAVVEHLARRARPR
jgi:hypothetical protein